jgi:hypothetical protein
VLDAAIYFWLPQINITILRVVQGRNLLHRMVGRTVVIGDIPWVAQSAEAFLSKVGPLCLMSMHFLESRLCLPESSLHNYRSLPFRTVLLG